MTKNYNFCLITRIFSRIFGDTKQAFVEYQGEESICYYQAEITIYT